MKRLLLASLLALTLGIAGCGESAPQTPEDLPWKSIVTPAGNTQIFHLELGKSTLMDAINHFREIPEIALFHLPDGRRSLEAWIGKQRIGLFEAKIVLEMQADDAQLAKFEAENINREAQESGSWKYRLSEPNVKITDNLPIYKLVYIPVVDYDAPQITKLFGEPSARAPVKDGVEYWFYPQKGVAILMNPHGGDIFYYTSSQNYPKLKQQLLTSKPLND